MDDSGCVQPCAIFNITSQATFDEATFFYELSTFSIGSNGDQCLVPVSLILGTTKQVSAKWLRTPATLALVTKHVIPSTVPGFEQPSWGR